jgi:LDH2 family malate/lactate/ureidoglycolate dehydrogenase
MLRGVIRCAADELRRFATAVVERMGAAPDEAAFVAGVIVASDLAGHESHGMRRLPEYVERWRSGRLDPGARPVVELDAGAVVRLHGANGFGHVAVRDQTDLAVARAREHGVAAIALRRANHAGRYADFCERAAAAGAAILFFVNDAGGEQDVAPPGGLEPRLATNPIAAGVPRRASPHLVLDMATSVIARGRLAEWSDRNEPIPAEWVTATGAIRPAAGYKGFGLSLVVEALAGALTGAGTVSASPEHDDQGVLAIALDVARLRPLDGFAREVDAMLDYVKDVPLEEGAEAVRAPGESGARAAAERLLRGVPVQPFTWARILRLARELGVPPPEPRAA